MNNHDSTRIEKIIAVDLDGTLVGHDNTISEENVQAIRRASQQGAVVVIVTGRPYLSADSVAKHLQLPDIPLVSFNGALIRWTGGGTTLYSQRLAADIAAEIVEACARDGLHVHYYLDDHLYVTQNNERSQSYCERNGMTCEEEPNLARFAGREPLKLLVIDEPEKIKDIMHRFQDRWKDRVYITRSMAPYLEFLSPEVSKGRALDWLLNFYNVPRERAMGIGDSMNDLPLLQHAGQPVAMPDADDELKQLAKFMPTDSRTGVAQAIDWFLDYVLD